jgi:hypothetical protein
MRNLLVFIFVFQLHGCSSVINEKSITGNWLVTKFEPHIDGISPQLIAEGRKIALSSTYSFRCDSSVVLSFKGKESGQKGRWKFFDGVNEIFIVYEEDNRISKEKFIVEIASANKMVLKQEIDGYGYMLFTLKRME